MATLKISGECEQTADSNISNSAFGTKYSKMDQVKFVEDSL